MGQRKRNRPSLCRKGLSFNQRFTNRFPWKHSSAGCQQVLCEKTAVRLMILGRGCVKQPLLQDFSRSFLFHANGEYKFQKMEIYSMQYLQNLLDLMSSFSSICIFYKCGDYPQGYLQVVPGTEFLSTISLFLEPGFSTGRRFLPPRRCVLMVMQEEERECYRHLLGGGQR